MGTPQIIVEVMWNAGPFDIGAGTWTDVTPYVRSANTKRGQPHELGRDEAGTAVIRLRNQDRRFDPDYANGPYQVSPGAVSVGRRVRVRATHNAVTYNVFYGFIEAIDQAWPGRTVGHVGDAEAVLTCVDLFRLLSGFEIGPSYREEVLLDEPLGYWPLDEGVRRQLTNLGSQAVELSEYQDTGAVSSVTGPIAGGGTALRTVGTSFFKSGLTDPEGWRLKRSYTFEAWVKWSSGIFYVVTSGDPAVAHWGSWTIDTSGKPRLSVTTEGGNIFVEATTALTTNVWTHIAVTREGTRVRFFKDGQPDGVRALSQAVNVSPYGLSVLKSDLGSAYDLAHLAIWSRALAPSRLTAHYERRLDTFPAQRVDVAVGRVLDVLGWDDVAERTLAKCVSVAGPVAPSGSALEFLQRLVADTEHGRFLIAPDGDATVLSRQTPWQSPAPAEIWSDGWRPPDVSTNVLAWYDAGTLAEADAAVLPTWPDLSGNGLDIAEATNRPTVQTNELNGQRIVRFDATNDKLTRADPASLDFGTVENFSVALVIKPADPAGIGRFWVRKKAGSTVGSPGWSLRVTAGGAMTWQISDGVTQVDTVYTHTPDEWHIVIVRVNRAGLQTLFVDSTIAVDSDSVTGVTGSIDNAEDLHVGYASGASADLAELVIWDKVLSAADVAATLAYFSRKYDLPVTGASDPTELLYEAVDPRHDDSDFYNRAETSTAQGAVASVEDAASVAAYGRRTLSRASVFATENEAVAAADGLLARYDSVATRVEAMAVRGAGNTTRLTSMLTRALGDRIKVRRQPPGGGAPIEKDVLVSSIEWKITAPAKWDVVWTLSPTEPTQFWLLGNATYGKLDTTSIPGW